MKSAQDPAFKKALAEFAEGNITSLIEEMCKGSHGTTIADLSNALVPQGPLEMTPESREIETIVKQLLGHFSGTQILTPAPQTEIKTITTKTGGNTKHLFITVGGKEHDFTALMANMNWAHIRLNTDDFHRYEQYVSKNGKSQMKPKKQGKNEYPDPHYFDARDEHQILVNLSYAEKLALNIYSGQEIFGYNTTEGKPGRYYAALNQLLRGEDPSEIFKDTSNKALSGQNLTDAVSEMLMHLAMVNSGLNKPVPVVPAATYRKEWNMPPSVIQERIDSIKSGGEILLNMQMASTSHTRPGFKPNDALGQGGCALAFVNLWGVDITSVSQSASENEVLIPPSQMRVIGHMVNSQGEHIFVVTLARTPTAFDPQTQKQVAHVVQQQNTPLPHIAIGTEQHNCNQQGLVDQLELDQEHKQFQFLTMYQLMDAISYAHQNYLSKPYPQAQLFPTNATHSVHGTVIHRPNHGLAHTLRKMNYLDCIAHIFNTSQVEYLKEEMEHLDEIAKHDPQYQSIMPIEINKVEALSALLYDENGVPRKINEIAKFFHLGTSVEVRAPFTTKKELNTYLDLVVTHCKLKPAQAHKIDTDDIRKLQAVLLFSVTGRESEAGFQDLPNDYPRYKENSKNNFIHYFKDQQGKFDGKNIFETEDNMLEFADLVDNINNRDYSTPHPKMKLYCEMLTLSHNLDLWRCRTNFESVILDEVDDFYKNFLHPKYTKVHQQDLTKYAEKCIVATGGGISSPGGYKSNLLETNTDPEKCMKAMGSYAQFRTARTYNLDVKMLNKEDWVREVKDAIIGLSSDQFIKFEKEMLHANRPTTPLTNDTAQLFPMPAPRPFGDVNRAVFKPRVGMIRTDIIYPQMIREEYKQIQQDILIERKRAQTTATPAIAPKGTMIQSQLNKQDTQNNTQQTGTTSPSPPHSPDQHGQGPSKQ